MNLTIGKGINSLLFGFTEGETQKLLGRPDKTYFTDCGCKRIQYNSLKVELSFEPENGNRLGWIEVHNPEAILLGDCLIGKQEKNAVEFLNSKLSALPKYEDYGSFLSINYEAKWLELQTQFGIVRSVNFGVLFGDNDAPLWPRT